MTATANTDSTPHKANQDVVEIKLWGFYLLLNRSALYEEIIQSSLDLGPVEKYPQTSGRVTFRFSVKAWETRIKKLLYSYRIPVVLKSGMSVGHYSQNSLAVSQ